jgi:hypothetical protein
LTTNYAANTSYLTIFVSHRLVPYRLGNILDLRASFSGVWFASCVFMVGSSRVFRILAPAFLVVALLTSCTPKTRPVESKEKKLTTTEQPTPPAPQTAPAPESQETPRASVILQKDKSKTPEKTEVEEITVIEKTYEALTPAEKAKLSARVHPEQRGRPAPQPKEPVATVEVSETNFHVPENLINGASAPAPVDVQQKSSDSCLDRSVISKAHEVLHAGEIVTEEIDREYFLKDVEAIKKRFSGNLERQYQFILLREYLNQLAESEFKYETIMGGRNPWRVHDVVRQVDTFGGLNEKLEIKKRGLRSLEADRPLFRESVLTFVEMSLVLEQVYGKLYRLEAEYHGLKSVAGLTEAKIKTREKELEDEMGMQYAWLNFFLTGPADDPKKGEPTLMLLNTKIDDQGTVLYEKLVADARQASTQGLAGEALLDEVIKKDWPIIKNISAGVLVQHRKAAFYSIGYATRMLDSDPSFFLRHNTLRKNVLDKLSGDYKNQIVALDKKWGQQYGLDDPEVQDKVDKLISISKTLGKGALTWTAYSISLPITAIAKLSWYAKESFDVVSLQEAMRLGSYTGLNSFDATRYTDSKSAIRTFSAGAATVFIESVAVLKYGSILDAPGKLVNTFLKVPTLVRTILSAPSTMTSAMIREWALTNSKFLWNGILNASSSAVINTISEGMQRNMGFWDLIKNPHYQLDMTTVILGDLFVGFYADPSKARYLDYMWNMALISATSSAIGQMFVNGKIDMDRVRYDFAYVGITTVFKARKIFGERVNPWVENRMRIKFGQEGKAVKLAIFGTGLLNNGMGALLYPFATRHLMEQKEFYQMIDEAVQKELGQTLCPQ